MINVSSGGFALSFSHSEVFHESGQLIIGLAFKAALIYLSMLQSEHFPLLSFPLYSQSYCRRL